nr:uncharacterized protein LOC129166781 isoform X1 [Nothobranchius furzeri]
MEPVQSCPRYTLMTRPRYCRIDQSVPVLDRFFNQQGPRPDFHLSRESLSVLLNLLNQDRRHGWGATIETLLFLFWLASEASYRVVSRAFGIPRSTVHRIVHRVTEEVVAIRHQVIHLPKTPEDLEVVSQGFAGLARHGAFFLKLQVPLTAATSGSSLQAALMVTATGTGNCSPPSSCRLCVTIMAASLTLTWAGRVRCTTPGCSATARCTGSQSTLLQGASSSQMVGTHACKAHSHSSLPTNMGIKVWLPSALTAIIPRHAL